MIQSLNEANIQAEFYHHCRLLGICCILELSTPVGRLDIAILNADKTHLLAIVECKKESREIREYSRQFRKYKSIGVPVIGLNKMSDAEPLARRVLAEFTAGGVELDAVKSMERQSRILRKHRFNPETDLDESIIYRR